MKTFRPDIPEYSPIHISRNRPSLRSSQSGARGPYRKQWSIGPGAKRPSHLKRPAYRQIGNVPAPLLARANEKLSWIQAFVVGGCRRGTLVTCATARARALGDESCVPPYATLRTWVERYLAFGLLGLADAPSGVARRTCRALSEPDRDFLRSIAAANVTATQAAHLLYGSERKRLVTQRVPAVRRYLDRLRAATPHAEVIATEGRVGHRQRNKLAAPVPLVLPGQRIAIDSTAADLWVQTVGDDPLQPTAVRPALTVIMDEGSRRLLTFGLFLTPVDSEILRALMARVFVPDMNWVNLPTVGLPAELNVDHGAEHQGKFKQAMLSLPITWVPRNPDAPQGGAIVERLHQTMQKEVFVHAPGSTTKFKPIKAEDVYAEHPSRRFRDLKYEPYRAEVAPENLWTMAQAEERIRQWAVRYNEEPHVALALDNAALVATLPPRN